MTEIAPEIDGAINELVSIFARVALIQRFHGVSEADLLAQFDAAVSAPLCSDFPEEIATEIKRRAYQKLSSQLTGLWSRVVIPDNPYTLH